MSKPRLFSRSLAVATLFMIPVLSFAAQKPVLASTPPMGWNSWDSYGLTITEDQFKANVEVEAARLKPAGYSYAVVDEGWYLGNPEAADKHPETLAYRMDANGLYQPSLNRFASAQGSEGFAPLAKLVHAKGLKFGIHIIRGVPKGAMKANLPVAGSGYRISDLADTSDTCQWNPDNFGVKKQCCRAGLVRLDVQAIRGLGRGLCKGGLHRLAPLQGGRDCDDPQSHPEDRPARSC